MCDFPHGGADTSRGTDMSILVLAAVALQDFAFLEGRWCGTALNGEVVERWEAPFGDAMSGTMTLVREHVVVFHEFFVITEVDGRWQLRLKHFDPDVVGWESREEVVSFPLESVAPRAAVFDGLSMQRIGPDGLRVEVSDGPVFDYRACPESGAEPPADRVES
jgi:hypothetical protein